MTDHLDPNTPEYWDEMAQSLGNCIPDHDELEDFRYVDENGFVREHPLTDDDPKMIAKKLEIEESNSRFE